MPTIIVEKKGLTKISFDSKEALRIIKSCLKKSNLVMTPNDLKTFASDLQQAIDWDQGFVNTTKKASAITAIRKHLAAIKKHSTALGLMNIVEAAEALDSEMGLMLGSTVIGKYLREHKARNTKLHFEDFLDEKIKRADVDRVQDSRHKLYNAFVKKIHRAYKGQRAVTDFLSYFYKDYYAPVVLKKSVNSKPLKNIYKQNVRPML